MILAVCVLVGFFFTNKKKIIYLHFKNILYKPNKIKHNFFHRYNVCIRKPIKKKRIIWPPVNPFSLTTNNSFELK